MTRKHTAPIARLTPEEAERVRQVVDARGLKRATRYFGLFSEVTLCKAMAPYDVHQLTVSCIRVRLAELGAAEPPKTRRK